MNRDCNIFYNLIKDENSTTELLCNLLQFDSFRKLFLNLIDSKLSIEYEHIHSQYDTFEYGLPDIVILSSNCALVIENKINNSTLTENQPANYIRFLEKQDQESKYFVFLIPKTYIHLSEIKNRLTNIKSNSIIKKIVYWEDLYSHITDSDIYKKDNIAINHFYDLIKKWYGYKNIPFSHEEILIMKTNEIPAIMIKMNNLIKEIRGKIEQIYKIKYDDEGYGYGFFVKDSDGRQILWFGYWFELWNDKNIQLAVGINHSDYPKYVVSNFKRVFPKCFVFDDNWTVEGITSELIFSLKNTDKIIDYLNKKIEKLLTYKK